MLLQGYLYKAIYTVYARMLLQGYLYNVVCAQGICIYLHSTAAERGCNRSPNFTDVSACMTIYSKCQQLMLIGVALRWGEAHSHCLQLLSSGRKK